MNLVDYDRVVIGYHGTRRATALGIVTHDTTFKPSRNSDDWLGHGVYFWEHAPEQAWKWAKHRYAPRTEIAVLGALIRLGNCFDLLDPENGKILSAFHADYLAECRAQGLPVRRNANARKYLDCATLQFAYAGLEAAGQPVDSCRGVYVPTGTNARLWERSWLSREAHIQLCVRNPACILGSWLVPSASTRASPR